MKTVMGFIQKDCSRYVNEANIIDYKLDNNFTIISKWKFKKWVIDKFNIKLEDQEFTVEHDYGVLLYYLNS